MTIPNLLASACELRVQIKTSAEKRKKNDPASLQSCAGQAGQYALVQVDQKRNVFRWLHHLLRRPLSGTLGGHREVGQARRRLATARSERREKTGKDGKRWEKTGKDGKFYFLIGKTIVVGRDIF